MSFYENVFIARQEISSAAVEALADRFAGIVAEHGGTVTKKEIWGLRNLTYKIKKNRKGHYVFFNIDAPSAAVQEMERQMRINEDILRFLTVKVDELDPNPSAMLQARSSRDERPRRGERRFGGPEGDEGPAGVEGLPVPVEAKGDVA
jgi:small subunit ribosomal protein S6